MFEVLGSLTFISSERSKGFTGAHPCGNLACPRCQAIARDGWARQLVRAVLHETPEKGTFIGAAEEFYPPRDDEGKVLAICLSGGSPLRARPVWTWQGPAKDWGTIHRQIRRAGAKSGRPFGCAKVKLGGADDGQIFVVSDVPFRAEGVNAAPPDAAALQLVRHTLSIPARRGFVSRSRSWQPEPKPVKCVDLGRVCDRGGAQPVVVKDGLIISGALNTHQAILEAGGAELEEVETWRADGTTHRDTGYSMPKKWVPPEVQAWVDDRNSEIILLEYQAARTPRRRDRQPILRRIRDTRRLIARAVRELLDDVYFHLFTGDIPVATFQARVSEFFQATEGEELCGKTRTTSSSEFDLLPPDDG